MRGSFHHKPKPPKYPPLNPLSGLTNLASIRERLRKFRTKDLYIQHQKHPIIRKHEIYKLQNGEGHLNILNVIDREEDTRKRRMLSHAFSTRNLEAWEFKIADKVAKLLVQFDKRALSPICKGRLGQLRDGLVDVRYWFNLFTVDAIADIALSEKLGMIEAGSDVVEIPGPQGEALAHRFISDMHEEARVKSRIIGTLDWYHILKRVSTFLSSSCRAQWDCGRKVGEIVSHLAHKRLQRYEDGEEIDDFLSCLIRDKAGKARDLDLAEITAETNILLDAGSETTAIALTHLLYYLIRNPAILAKLREEVSEALAGEQVAPYAKVKNLPYLKACIEESLRLSPPLPRGLERVTPPSGTYIMGTFIPGNVGASVPAYVVHRDPDLFPEPEEFIPERWIENQNIAKMREAFIPFSAGGRACIGRNIAMIEQQILIATLVYRYDFGLLSDDWILKNEEAIWRRGCDV
ncbi:cytochrome P450 [Aspergillus carlsbadensis]|nr:cytochrome P450 [Aspergillus carlsbadensis]